MIYLGFILIFIGFIAILLGVVGLLRFSDLYNKLHAAGVIDSAAIPLILMGLSFLQQNSINNLKLIFIIFLIWLLNPVSSYMLAKANLILENKKQNNGF